MKNTLFFWYRWATPEQTFYGGDVKGESGMEYLEDIGTKVKHTYQVRNL